MIEITDNTTLSLSLNSIFTIENYERIWFNETKNPIKEN